MKSRIAASLVSLAAFAAVASPVSLSDADGFVRRWRGSSEDFDGSEIVRTIAVSNGQDVAYYLAVRSSGSAVAVSPDTDLYPVLAQAEKVADSDGNVTLEPEHPLWTMLMDGATNSLAKVRKRVLLASLSAKTSPEESDKRTNRARWSAFSRRLTAAYVPTSSDVYGGNEHVLAGFESGGVLTHWSQNDARKDFRGYAPLYNYYMHEAAPTGLGLDGTYMDYPCGCVATAYAAAAQFHGFTGIVDNGVYQNQLLVSTNMTGETPLYDSKTVSIIPGQYDWSILPSNYGGSAPAVSSYADFPAAAKELIGRVAYNYGIMLNMQYERSSSGAVVLTPDRKGTLGYGFLDYTKITRDHAHANCPGNLLSGDTAEHIANVIETLVRMNEPAVMSIKSATSGHCVLGVGARGTGTGRYLRVFMGDGGVGDTWFYGGNTIVTSTYTSISKVCATGGVDHPTTFIHSKFLGCTVSGGSVVFGKVNADAGQNSIVITNADDTIIVAGFCHPYYPEAQSGPGTLSGSVTYSMDPFQSGGVTVTPNPETKRVSRSYSFTTSRGARIVSYSGTSFFDTSFGLTATGSKSNGFPYGTPYSLDSFMYTAFTNNVPAVIISGHDGSTAGVVGEFKTGRTAALLSQCAVYFVDVGSDSREGVVDGEYSYAVIDPFGSYLGDMWSADSSYRLSYGTFTDPSEIYSIVSSGIAKYSTLSITRQNGYGLKWYQHPKIDTNPYYVHAGTTSLDLNSVRGQGYTSIHATGLTSMTRSNVSYTDSTVRYVDFSQCPCTSSSSQLLRNFKALITTDGLPSGFTSIPNYCFADCTALEKIDALPSGVTTLNQGAFYGCTSLKSAALPESVRTIGQDCFMNCKNLDNTDGIGKVTSIGSSAFSMSTTGYDGNHAFSITEWPISSVPGYVFLNRNGISSITNLPTNVTSFANYAFSGVRGITDVVVPASVKSFGSYCFAYMYQVKTMDLLGTSGDFSIGQYAFYQMGTQNDSCIITFHCTKSELQAKANYPFTPYTGYGMVFRCTDGDINL